MELKKNDLKFSGEDLIIIFDFLDRLVEEADTLDISEGQLMGFLMHMFTETVAREYSSTSSGNRVGNRSY